MKFTQKRPEMALRLAPSQARARDREAGSHGGPFESAAAAAAESARAAVAFEAIKAWEIMDLEAV